MKLSKYMRRKKLTTNEVARLSNLAYYTVQRIEQGGGCNVASMARLVVATNGEVQPWDLIAEPWLSQRLRHTVLEAATLANRKTEKKTR